MQAKRIAKPRKVNNRKMLLAVVNSALDLYYAAIPLEVPPVRKRLPA